jgi:hypothetical protein
MSGTLVGVVDCLHTTALYPVTADRQKNTFVNLYDFMQRHVTVGNATLHASNYGNGASGFDYHDGANPVGENAWAVFKFLASASSVRTTDFYVLIQWADGSSFGSAPGNPGSIENATSDGLGIVMAYREDNGDPWNGTTNANGADTKGTPVWTGTGLHVLTKYNETGARSTNKEDLTRLWDVAGISARVHMCGDADGMWFAHDVGASDVISTLTYVGVYTPRSDLVVPNPYIIAANQISLLNSSFLGSTPDDNGIIGIDESRGVVGFHSHRLGFISDLQQPENLSAGLEYMDLPIYVSRPLSEDAVEYGLLGHLPTNIVRLAYGQANGSANAAFTRAFLSDVAVAADHKFSLAWGGGAGPNLAPDRDGLVF